MNVETKAQPTGVQPSLITINVNLARLKKPLYYLTFTLMLVGAVSYAYFRDWASTTTQHQGTPQTVDTIGSPLMRSTVFTGRGTSGHSFTVTSPKNFHLSVRGSTGSHVVINKWQQNPPVYSSGQGNKKQADFDDEVFLESGDYVLSLVAVEGRPAKAFIEIR